MSADMVLKPVVGGILIGWGVDSLMSGVISDAVVAISPIAGIALLALGVLVAFGME